MLYHTILYYTTVYYTTVYYIVVNAATSGQYSPIPDPPSARLTWCMGPGCSWIQATAGSRGTLGSAADELGFRGLGMSDLIENRSFWRSGRPLETLEPSKEVGGFAPHLFGWF